MDYQGRLTKLRQRMAAADVDLLHVSLGADLFYLTGIQHRLVHGTDHNAYGDWATGGYLHRDGGLIVLAPRMGGHYFETAAEGKPWIDQVRLIQESEDPLQVMQQTIEGLSGTVRAIALDDRDWAKTSLAFRALYPDARYSLASELIAPLRMIKDDDEIAAMRRASELADHVFEQVVPFLKIGLTEYEIAREVDYQFELAGADFTSFETAVMFYGPDGGPTGGSGGVTRITPGRRLRPGDSLCFDFGCVLAGYCSDFGRSAFVGEPPAEYLRVHELVLQAQRAGIEAMRAGQATAAQTNALARAVIAEAGYDAAFTHRLGHAIGVTVHEAPFLDVMDQTVLQERMMFTVEPSIFIPGKLGNRVEDVVMVTPHGGEVLNRAPHDLVVIE